jgi:dipeptidyl aminopeptidase/acylaminoacyl peptidase
LINATNDADRPVLKEPVDIDKQTLFIENMRNKIIPGNKITVVKLMETNKEYKSYLISYPVEKKILYAMMSIPASKKPVSGFPVVIVNHGYIPPGQYSTLTSYRLVTGYYASNGFLTLKPDYRGFGNSIKEDEGSFFGRIDYVYDVLYLMNATGSIPEADMNNIFMYGHSMGGDVTLRVLEMTGRVKAATLWAPVSAMFPESVLYYMRKRNSGQSADAARKILDAYFSLTDYEKMSGLANTNYITAPLLLHHGTLDDSVPYQWSIELMKRFDHNKIAYQFYSYTGEDHNFSKGSFYKVLKKDADFFKRFLSENEKKHD